MKKAILTLLLTPIFCFAQYNQLGNDIDGIETNESSGSEVQLNGLGNIVILGARNNDSNGNGSGQARIFEWNGSNWNQKGSFISGDSAGENLGDALSINDTGTVIACGAPGFTSNPSIAGYAKVLEWNGTDWIQRGPNLNGLVPDDNYGTSISLNSTGTIVAVAAEPFSTVSYIQVFEWDGNNWNQLGSDIIGTASQDGFARSIALDASGTSLVVGVENYDTPINDNGMMRVYQWNGSNWLQKGSDIVGDNQDDFFGRGVSINASGNSIAAGARDALDQSAGYVKVFEWDGADWVQKGNTTFGNGSDFFGDVNQLNSSGNIIISGSVLGEYAKVFEWDGANWLEIDSISGENSGDQFGSAVSVNSIGDRVAIGAFGNDDGGLQSGHVRLFNNPAILGLNDYTDLNGFKLYPNPTNDYVQIVSEKTIQSYQLISIEGKIIESQNMISSRDFSIDLSTFLSGLYVLIIKNDENHTLVHKILKN